MKLHTINQWSATAGFAIILIWLTTATLAQTELKEALEDIANVRVSRSEIKKEIRSKLEQKKVRKRQPELIEDLEASGSDFQPIVYRTINEVPRVPGFQSLFPPLEQNKPRQITTPHVPPTTPSSSETEEELTTLSRTPRGILEQISESLSRNMRSPSPQKRPRSQRQRLKRRNQQVSSTTQHSTIGQRSNREAQLFANGETDSYASPAAKPISILPSSPTPTPIYYQFETREAVPDFLGSSDRGSHLTTTNPFERHSTIHSNNFPSVTSSSNYGSPNVQINPSSFPVVNQPFSNARIPPQGTYGSSTFRSSVNDNLNNFVTSTQSIWRDQVAKESFSKGNVHQASGYEVPPVITNNVGHSSSHGGLKTGYFPPTQRVMPRVNQMEAECSDDVMKLRVKFNATFDGLIYSAGYAYDNDCIYINGTGADEYEFYIQLNRCGTLGGSDHNKKREVGFKNTEPTKNFMWNTVTIQYNPLIEEEWDEHFKVTCEYGYDFWKTVTFPFLDVEVNTADPVHFTLVPPECHMEIRAGYGAQGPRVTGPVHVGDPLTLLINMRSQFDGFDIVVNDCYAHNGANKKIQLIDHHGCPVDEKLISKFQGSWGMDGAMYQTVIYAHMKTFRFTGTPALYIECDIRMCHGRCPTQSCNWRNVRRRKRSTGEIDREPRGLEAVVDNDDQYFDLEEVEDSSVVLDGQVGATAPTPNTNQSQPLSENLRIFQAIHVLQGREEEEEGGSSQTTSSAVLLEDVEDNICLRSMVFASIFGILSLFTLTSSVAVSLLCMRVRRMKKSDPTYEYRTTTSTRGQLRAARSAKSDYVHSIHQRIP